ncbi:hypothetical protein N7474_005999 [Penicillium riverlandense]|uniref:uncharacterized protein n=1 Tax=Penicillium riverlandense TaxID=1903569 RepID=UPI002548CEF3|nr:uncharacterized protein N7474_005999 [Penicillium riverlandense]KAJ5820408.1 hypothetical protein N7474_005999 [Penicillium riverlandense]
MTTTNKKSAPVSDSDFAKACRERLDKDKGQVDVKKVAQDLGYANHRSVIRRMKTLIKYGIHLDWVGSRKSRAAAKSGANDISANEACGAGRYNLRPRGKAARAVSPREEAEEEVLEPEVKPEQKEPSPLARLPSPSDLGTDCSGGDISHGEVDG